MKRRQMYLIVGAAAAVLFLCVAGVIYGFTNNFGMTTIIRRDKSPDGAWVTTVFENDCGATCTREVDGIALTHESRSTFSVDDIVFTRAGVSDLDAHWVDSHTLAITGSTDFFEVTPGIHKNILSNVGIHYEQH